MRGEQNTVAGCAPKPTPITTFLGPCAILASCFLLPSTLRTEALIPVGGEVSPQWLLGLLGPVSTFPSLQGTSSLQGWRQSQHTPHTY